MSVDKSQILVASYMMAAASGNVPGTPEFVASAVNAGKRLYLDAKDEYNPVMKAIDGLDNAKVFTGVVRDIKLEKSSTRGVLTLETKPSEFHPDGMETMRTERTAENPDILKLMAHIRDDLMGHKVAVWVEVQNPGGLKKFRVLHYVKDLGLPQEAPETAA